MSGFEVVFPNVGERHKPPQLPALIARIASLYSAEMTGNIGSLQRPSSILLLI